MKGLQAVLSVRTRERDEKRLVLAKLLQEDAALEGETRKLTNDANAQLAEVAGLGRGGPFDVRAAASRRYHALHLRRSAAAVGQRRIELVQKISEARQALADADASRKAVERLIERRAEEARVLSERRGQLRAEDEFASRRAAESDGSTGRG